MANDMLPDDACRHLFVTDLDGTLLTNDAKVSRRTAHIISDLSHRGAMITVATARTPATVDRLLQHTFTRLPAIVMTGAAMWDRRHRICVDIHPISTASSEIAISTCRKYGITPFIYTLAPDSTLDVYINGDITPREQKFIDDRLGLQLKRFHINTPEGLRTGFENNMLIFAMGEYDRLEQVQMNSAGTQISQYHSIPTTIILTRHCSKYLHRTSQKQTLYATLANVSAQQRSPYSATT